MGQDRWEAITDVDRLCERRSKYQATDSRNDRAQKVMED
jgi:hypothetical protein